MATEVQRAGPGGIAAAADVLRRGELVAFPTETVYGLGGDARSGAAVARIFEAKGRPRFNPLIAHVPDVEQALGQGVFNADARRLATALWPGPLTLVVPASPACTICDLARAGLDSVALRVPSHPVALALLRRAGMPIAAPSANRSGRISPTAAGHVARDLGGTVAFILDGGPTAVGVESTIVACLDDEARLLRPGGVTREEVESALGRRFAERMGGPAILAPGALASHYAPALSVRLDATDIARTEAVLDFGGRFDSATCMARLDLSPKADLREAAVNLFGYLHRLDATGAERIAVAPIPEHGLGEAINDRLRRAAAPRG